MSRWRERGSLALQRIEIVFDALAGFYRRGLDIVSALAAKSLLPITL